MGVSSVEKFAVPCKILFIVAIHLAIQALILASLQACHWYKLRKQNILNKRNS